jgi:hypothetical protein
VIERVKFSQPIGFDFLAVHSHLIEDHRTRVGDTIELTFTIVARIDRMLRTVDRRSGRTVMRLSI